MADPVLLGDIPRTPRGDLMNPAVPKVVLPDQNYDPARQREDVRSDLAKWLVGLLGIVVIGPYLLILGGIFCGGSGADPGFCAKVPGMTLKEATDTLLTPLVGLVGAVAGFYFGENKSK